MSGKKEPYPVINIIECKACGRCIVACPKGVLKMSDDINERGYHYIDRITSYNVCYTKLLRAPVGFDYVWHDAIEHFKGADASIINLETAVTTSDDAWPNKGIKALHSMILITGDGSFLPDIIQSLILSLNV